MADIVTQFWGSWMPGTVVDQEREFYADHTEVRPINYKDKYFSCRGPLNTIPGPQQLLPIAAAGNLPPGRDFAARYADTMLVISTDAVEMKRFRAAMHRRLRDYGRKPEDLKLLFIATPFVVEATKTPRNGWRSSRRHDGANAPSCTASGPWPIQAAVASTSAVSIATRPYPI